MFCSHCGNEITEGASFCSCCGKPVTKDKHKLNSDATPLFYIRIVSMVILLAALLLFLVSLFGNVTNYYDFTFYYGVRIKDVMAIYDVALPGQFAYYLTIIIVEMSLYLTTLIILIITIIRSIVQVIDISSSKKKLYDTKLIKALMWIGLINVMFLSLSESKNLSIGGFSYYVSISWGPILMLIAIALLFVFVILNNYLKYSVQKKYMASDVLMYASLLFAFAGSISFVNIALLFEETSGFLEQFTAFNVVSVLSRGDSSLLNAPGLFLIGSILSIITTIMLTCLLLSLTKKRTTALILNIISFVLGALTFLYHWVSKDVALNGIAIVFIVFEVLSIGLNIASVSCPHQKTI